MKKHFYLFLAAMTLGLTACSDNDEGNTASSVYTEEQLIGSWREYKAIKNNEWVHDDLEFIEWGFSYGHAGYWNTYQFNDNKHSMEWDLSGNQLIIIERDITKIYTDTYTIKQLTNTELIVWIMDNDPESGISEKTRYFKRVGY